MAPSKQKVAQTPIFDYDKESSTHVACANARSMPALHVDEGMVAIMIEQNMINHYNRSEGGRKTAEKRNSWLSVWCQTLES